LFDVVRIYGESQQKIRSFRLTLLTASAESQVDGDKEQVEVTKVTVILCQLKEALSA